MVVTVNGERQDVAATRIDSLLVELGHEGSHLAVALNGAVVRRAGWAEAIVRDGDEVEILTPRQGG